MAGRRFLGTIRYLYLQIIAAFVCKHNLLTIKQVQLYIDTLCNKTAGVYSQKKQER